MDINKIIIGPLLTEKGAVLTESLNKYLFKVEKGSNKIQIKKAVESRFNVKVKKVAIVNVKGKLKSMSVKSSARTIRTEGRRSSYKKTIITLKDGYTIDLLGGDTDS